MAEITGMKMLDARGAADTANASQEVDKVKALAQRKIGSEKEIKKASAGFESLLVNEMLKSMWSTVQTTNLMGEDSNEAQIYRGMLNQGIADTVSKGQGIGIKEYLKKELTRMQHASKSKAEIG